MDRLPLIEPVVGAEELEKVRQVLDSGHLTQGPIAERFEEQFADFVDADSAVTVTSCTAGIQLALEAIGIGKGDEVIIPDFTHPATANAVVRTDAHPVLVDVDLATYNIDTDAVRAAITDRTAAIVPVSWGGQPLGPAPLRELADEYDLSIIEDAACAAGAEYDGEPVGSQFDVSVFSFHPRKVITTGEGGMVTTNNPDLEDTMRQIKNFGTNPNKDTCFVRADATNYRLSDILAAVGIAQLEKKDEIINRRREIARRYSELLANLDRIIPPSEPQDARHTYQSYSIYIDVGGDEIRDELIESLAKHNIEAQIGTYALHMTPAFSSMKTGGRLENSRALYQNLLTLPITHSMTETDQVRVIEALAGLLT